MFCVGLSEKETAQAFVQLPREFPVYLWQPFARHSYYCFQEPEAQRQFSAVLSDCVRHSNYGECKKEFFLHLIYPGRDLNSCYSKKQKQKQKPVKMYERCSVFSASRNELTYTFSSFARSWVRLGLSCTAGNSNRRHGNCFESDIPLAVSSCKTSILVQNHRRCLVNMVC